MLRYVTKSGLHGAWHGPRPTYNLYHSLFNLVAKS